MIVILQDLLEATGRGLRARASFAPETSPLVAEFIGDEARLREAQGPIDVELDFDVVTRWALAPMALPGLFPLEAGEVAIVGRVTAVVDFERTPPIVDLSLGLGIVSFETDERTPKVQEGDFLAVHVRGLRCYPTWI
jgi:hypothetical protein